MFHRTLEACRADLETSDDYFSRILGVSPDHALLTDVIHGIIKARCADYLENRYKDWPLPDLLTMLKALEPAPKAVDLVDAALDATEAPRRRGRPPKGE